MARRTIIISCVTALLMNAGVAVAQTPAETFADVPRVLETGKKVVVTDVDGRRIKGRVAEISPTSMTLFARDEWGTERRHVFTDADVRAINKTDSVWNGLLIGLGVGIVAGEVFVRQVCGPRERDDECAAIATGVELVTFVPGGAVIGALVDKFTGKTLLYGGTRRSALSIAPVVGPKTGGAVMTLRF